MAEYGRLLAAPTIERGVEVCLRAFMRTYLGEVLAQAGHDRFALPDPEDMARVAEPMWPKVGNLALVVVASPGTVGDAEVQAEHYTPTWEVVASVLCDLGERIDSREAATFYAAAAGAALAHQGVPAVERDADGVWQGVLDADGAFELLEGSTVTWRGERARVVAERPGQALLAGDARVTVTVEGARSRWGGPETVPEDPTDRPEGEAGEPVEIVPNVIVEKRPISDD